MQACFRHPEEFLKMASVSTVVPSSIATLNDIFLGLVQSNREGVFQWESADGAWSKLSSQQVDCRVRAVARALQSWGIQRGDRVAILSENRWEWAITDFAILALGAVVVPIYPTLTAEQATAQPADSGSRILFTSSVAHARSITSLEHSTVIERIVLFDAFDAQAQRISTRWEAFSAIVDNADNLPGDPAFVEELTRTQPDDLATLVYTSGTTGESKGAMLTHGNIVANIHGSTPRLQTQAHPRCISYLPLPHIFERMFDYLLLANHCQVAYCSQMDKLPALMLSFRPTEFIGVPRVYEKIRAGVEQKSSASPLKARIFRWALQVGERHRETILAGQRPSSLRWKLADRLVFSKVRAAFGGCVGNFVSGGAPLGLETGLWFAAVGIAIQEGYGLTETSPVISVNYPGASRMGTVGLPLANVECRLAPDGELIVRGPSIFRGYWNKPEATRECLDSEGWFATGDIASIDADGFISITDRKKELLKTSGGKLIAPQPIETKLKSDPLVANAALIGDKHKFLVALISPNFAALSAWASGQGIDTSDRARLVAHPRVLARYEHGVAEVNHTLAKFESIKRFHLVADEWSLETGELTPSLKLKRRVVTARYAPQIAQLYSDESTSSAV